jgi:hypothetical protein
MKTGQGRRLGPILRPSFPRKRESIFTPLLYKPWRNLKSPESDLRVFLCLPSREGGKVENLENHQNVYFMTDFLKKLLYACPPVKAIVFEQPRSLKKPAFLVKISIY